MQDQVVKPIYLSVNQLTDLFSDPQQNSVILDDHQNYDNNFPNQDSFADLPLEFSFSALNLINSEKTIKEIQNKEKPPTSVLVSKEYYQMIMLKMELNRKLSEQNQQMIKENQELIQKRKQLEDQNAVMLDQNFQIKRDISEMKQKLFISQSALPLRKDKQIIELRNQYKELQVKASQRQETQSTIMTENSTADSDKSNSYYCNTSRLVRVDQSSSHHQATKPYRSRNNSFVKIVKN
ncbi:unnamed protein product [Paramecium sonneborni]|uniref:Uncharacterized protein n=1 Tax=Paramecium sonneborni TaxID=65129 RepID=A0A8S1R8M8_9CILI|nr:unnamed protein product [Paramecium sonneborni]